jgi:predicted helicase
VPANTIHELLAELRSSALDEQDKGTKFERLVRAYLESEPEWTSKFETVVPWMEWDRSDGQDRGIDLVAKLRDADGFAAIQCKFYAENRKVDKAAIDSFLAASLAPQFEFAKGELYVFDTAAGWTENVEKQLVGVAQRIPVSYLEDAAIDWSQFSWLTPEVVVSTEPKKLRPHQTKALENVRAGFETHDRGKLIMACGTGKTFTSLRIAEDLVGESGSVLFLVPSIQLLSQSLREWMANAAVDIRPFAVCSDVRVGRRVNTDDADDSIIDLTSPATTNAATLVQRMNAGKRAKARMSVVFATYQSIDVVAEAQRLGAPAFDLIVCDEAHRTTGVTLADQDESAFVKVHDGDFLKADRRLYMTATPRVFDDAVTKKAIENNAELANMNDESKYGPEFHRLGFGDAVDADLLTDYKVLVLTVDQQYVSENFQNALARDGEIKLDDVAKLLGCWNGLSKNFGDGRQHPPLMKTAVAFAQNIKASKLAANAFPEIVDDALVSLPADRQALKIEAQHVDGTMGIQERNEHLAWLKESTAEGTCRILTNARCLSEGVDVPSLDAVLFLTPRGSQVDVVQSVGRVMRKAPGKELGYIILPVVVPVGVEPEEALKDNQRYKVVWQVLQALRSHDERFQAMVNKIELNKAKPTDKLDIISVTTPTDDDSGGGDGVDKPTVEQLSWNFPTEQFRDAMYAKIVQKVGERRYWESWSKSVAEIAEAHIARIEGLLADRESRASVEFATFLDGLRGNLNDNITQREAVEMLAQHLVTRPIFEALFEGYDFTENNPVAQTMERMLAVLDEHNVESENATLHEFYEAVRKRVAGIDNAEGKQKILIELYDKFFSVAFKKTADKLGIVYTPVEIVDFILRSADAVLRHEFGQGLTDEGVHILDGFTGTGTFLVRLLQSGLIDPHDLARKYAEEIHGNEILLLAYYIAAANIEAAYQELVGAPSPFPGLILTDTFQSWEPDDRPDLDVFPENNARLEHLKQLPITVIVGNPPYSFGQGSANEGNANESYPALDEEIRNTYVASSTARNSNRMYDSYIRSIKWASLRLRDRGVVAFVTNGGWLESKAADGMRRSLEREFSSIYIFNLRGNQRSADWRNEGGKVFDAGSQATVAITVLVKLPQKLPRAQIQYAQVADGLTRAEKLQVAQASPSILELSAITVEPNEEAEWIGQRRSDFQSFMPLGDRESSSSLLSLFCYGLNTARQAWVYASNSLDLRSQVDVLIGTYSEDLKRLKQDSRAELTRDDSIVKWSRTLEGAVRSGKQIEWSDEAVRTAIFRPFNRALVYFDSLLNDQRYQLARLFPVASAANFGFYATAVGASKQFSALMVDALPDLNLWGSEGGQFFPRYRYEPVAAEGMLSFATADTDVVDGYHRIDNITDEALRQFETAYPGETVTKDGIFYYAYGLLHSPKYRGTYATDLKKMLPRLPLVKDFAGYARAGLQLSHLHLNYESVDPYPLDGLDVRPTEDPYDFFAVKKMSLGKSTADQKAAGDKNDRGVIVYNDHITLAGVPEDAYRYTLGSKSAIEWIIDRYQVKTDAKSGIVNDPNDWSREVGDPRYIIDLLARVVTVSIETMKIVDALPALDVIE